jgi:hypothetical protein
LVIAYTSEHYGKDPKDGAALVGMATLAAAHFFRKHYNISSRTDTHMDDIHGKGWDLNQEPGAFWVADMCLDSKVEVDEKGVEHKLDRKAPPWL